MLQEGLMEGNTFTRANDFGYSKHPDETLTIWDKNEVLPMCSTIRKNFNQTSSLTVLTIVVALEVRMATILVRHAM
ncbi:MAG: hypothetical protein R2793_00340 [Flavobacteriaceae bacterium]